MKEISPEEFKLAFPDKVTCLKFLHNVKWSDDSTYRCKKCNNTKYNDGVSFLSRRCSSCNYEESCTSNTIFERLRIELPKAFYMTYLIYRSKTKITIDQLTEKTELNKTAVWRFKKRVVERYQSMENSGRLSELDGWDQLI